MRTSIIVSDVGGTNGRFAIADLNDENQKPKLHSIHVFKCREYETFADMMEDYLSRIDCDKPTVARLAIAGEMTPKQGNLWHFNWEIDARELERRFGFKRIKLMNDYEALVKAIPFLSETDLVTLTPFEHGLNKAPYSVFGIGSGLGAAIGVPRKAGPKVVPTEIGHISFAPKTEEERNLLSYLAEKLDHVSIETLLSGPGVVRLYNFILKKSGQQPEEKTAPEITSAAADGNNPACVKTIELFLSILASVAGDIAIAQGARGGIYIGGGIIPKITQMIDAKSFMARFIDKGPMRSYVEKIPVHIITAEMPALIGAAILKTK